MIDVRRVLVDTMIAQEIQRDAVFALNERQCAEKSLQALGRYQLPRVAKCHGSSGAERPWGVRPPDLLLCTCNLLEIDPVLHHSELCGVPGEEVRVSSAHVRLVLEDHAVGERKGQTIESRILEE